MTYAEAVAMYPPDSVHTQIGDLVRVMTPAEYEAQSDGIYFAWQRGDATEVEWREAVAKVKSENPYPPNPAG